MADDEEFWNEDGLIDRDEDQYGYGQYDEEDFDSDNREQVASRETSTFKHSVTGNGSPMKKASQQARRRPEAAGRSNFKQLYSNQKPKARARPAETKPRSQPVMADMFNEKRYEMDSLRNEISDLKFEISKLKEENRTLKNQLRLQEKSLQKLDHDEANFGGYLKKYQDDLRVQQELSRRYREEKLKLEYTLKDRDVEMERCRAEISKLREVISADGLDERSALAAKLQSSEQERIVHEKRLQELQKHSDNLEKNHRFQLQTATKRYKLAEKRSDQLVEENRKLRFELAEKIKMLEIQNIYSKRHANILRIPHYLPELGDAAISEPHRSAVKFDPHQVEDEDEGEDEDEAAENDGEKHEADQDADDRQSDASARIKFDLEEEMDDANRPATNIQTAVQLQDEDAAPQDAEKRPPSHRDADMNAPLPHPHPHPHPQPQEEQRPKSASRSLSRQQTDEQLRVDEVKKKRLLAALNAIDTTGSGASNSPTSNARSSHSSRLTNGDESESEAKRLTAENGAAWDFLTSMGNGNMPSQPAKVENHLLDSLEFGSAQGAPLTKAKPPKPSGLTMANGPPKAKARLTPKEYSFVRAVESMHLGMSAAEEHSESSFNARFNQAERNSKLLPRRSNIEKPTSLSFNDEAEESYGAHVQANADSELAARRALHAQYSAKSLDTDDVEEINI